MTPRRRLTWIAAGATGACLALLAARTAVADVPRHGYLVWNLFLAWIPLVLALVLTSRRRSRAVVLLLGAAWLAFLPNAPYLVTDAVHLPHRSAELYWVDLVLLAGAAATGLLLGSAGLWLVQEAVTRRHGTAAGWWTVAACLPLVGIGMGVGRFARWNSWDLVVRPGTIAGDVADWVADPAAHAGPVAASILLTGLAAGAYLMFHALIGTAPAGRRPGLSRAVVAGLAGRGGGEPAAVRPGRSPGSRSTPG